MTNDDQQQQTLTGDPVNETEDEQLDDAGEPFDNHETKGGFNRYEISSLLQKAIRRSDREKAMFATFELARSGHSQHVWKRLNVVLIEDIRVSANEADLLAAVHRLEQMAEQWGHDNHRSTKAAMRAASLLAEAESSRELYLLAGHWEEIAEGRLSALNAGEDPQRDFPVSPDLADVKHIVQDMHTYAGRGKGQGYGHYLTTASRTTGMTELEREAKRKRMEDRESEYEFTATEYERAVKPVDEDDPWPADQDLKHHCLDNL